MFLMYINAPVSVHSAGKEVEVPAFVDVSKGPRSQFLPVAFDILYAFVSEIRRNLAKEVTCLERYDVEGIRSSHEINYAGIIQIQGHKRESGSSSSSVHNLRMRREGMGV